MKRWLLQFVVFVVVPVHPSAGVVLLSNMPQLNDDLASLLSPASGMVKAMGFTMPAGSSCVLKSVTLRLGSYDAEVAPLVQLRSNSGRLSPSETVLLTFRNQHPQGSKAANYVFLPVEAFLLTPGATYWLCVSNPSGALYWYASYTPTATKRGIASHTGDYTSQLEGDFLVSSVTNSVEILAESVSPVPSSSRSGVPSDSPQSSPSGFPSDSPQSSPSADNNGSSTTQLAALANDPDVRATLPVARGWLWAVLGCTASAVVAGVGLWRWRAATRARRSEAVLGGFFDFNEVFVDQACGIWSSAGFSSPAVTPVPPESANS